MSSEEIRELSKAFEEQGTEEVEELLARAVCRENGRKLVRTNDALYDTKGFIVSETLLKGRRSGAWGELCGHVPGHGGDVWYIRHVDMSPGVYSTHEFVEVSLDSE